MKIIDVGAHAKGFIAIGQEATGFFALGQLATGVIAVGQLARGFIAIGQLAVGLVGWGQVGAGVLHAVGMLGVGGRGFGGVLRVVPSIGRPRRMPRTTTLAAVEGGEPGWIEAQISADLALWQGNVRLPVKIDRRLQKGAAELAGGGGRPVVAYTTRVGSVLVCDRLAYAPPRPHHKKGFWPLAAVQLAGLLALGTVWVAVAGNDVVNAMVSIMADDAGQAPSPPRPAKPVRRPRVRTR